MTVTLWLLACTSTPADVDTVDDAEIVEPDAAVNADTAEAADAGADAGADTGEDDGDIEEDEAPRCVVNAEAVRCSFQTTFLTAADLPREVHWQTPIGAPPVSGWPTVLAFHGSTVQSETYFAADRDALWGGYTQAQITATLLENGFAVIAPEADPPEVLAWDTNFPGYVTDWTRSPDHALMLEVFDAIEAGRFGTLDVGRLYAMGLSSGGYMSSRVAIAYPGRFQAIAIAGASYATCAGGVCSIPALPEQHPPTLLMHGAWDVIVPLWTAQLYENRLRDAGARSRLMVQQDLGHAWIQDSPRAVLDWFSR